MDDPAIVSVSAEAPPLRPESSGGGSPPPVASSLDGHCPLASFLNQGGLLTAPHAPQDEAEADGETDPADQTVVANLITYSSEALKSFRETELSTLWPDCLEVEFKNERGVWDPNRWHKEWQSGPNPPLSLRPNGRRGPSESNDDGRSVSSLSNESKVIVVMKEKANYLVGE